MDPIEELQKALNSHPGYSKALLSNLRELLYTAGEGDILPFNQLEDREMQDFLSMINIARQCPPGVFRKFRM